MAAQRSRHPAWPLQRSASVNARFSAQPRWQNFVRATEREAPRGAAPDKWGQVRTGPDPNEIAARLEQARRCRLPESPQAGRGAPQEPSLAAEVTLGKRCARLDLRSEQSTFRAPLKRAEVIVHGYRPGALAGLGLGPFDGLIDVALDAYGWTGPWAGRRGFDSLVQMSTGIAHAGMEALGASRPTPLPVQALDHATGYLMAAAVVRALRGGPSRARLSLARTAGLLVQAAGNPTDTIAAPPPGQVEDTEWGRLLRLGPPVRVGGLKMSR